jgi:anti-sigma regulatory factor (Ser/Thr protein kinase)
MPNTKNCKEFVFLNARPALIPSVKQVLEYVEQHYATHEQLHDIYFKTKAIVTELLTNGFKHAGTPTIILQVDIGNKYLTIKNMRTVYLSHSLPIAPCRALKSAWPMM